MLSISIRISHFKANDNGHVPWRNSLCEKKKWSNTVSRSPQPIFNYFVYNFSKNVPNDVTKLWKKSHCVEYLPEISHTSVSIKWISSDWAIVCQFQSNWNHFNYIFNEFHDVIIANVHFEKENNEFIFLLVRQAIFQSFLCAITIITAKRIQVSVEISKTRIDVRWSISVKLEFIEII